MKNPEHYEYIKATFDCGEISWEYRLNGSEIVGRGCDDQDPDDCMDYSDDYIKALVRSHLCVDADDPVEIEWGDQKTMKTETTTAAPTVGSSALFCDCVDWCRDGRDMFSKHHPRCEHYEPPPEDPRYARFGKAMWKLILKEGVEFCYDEWSEDVLPLAESAGLCCRVAYDPEIHGDGIDAEPGDEIWWWGAESCGDPGCLGNKCEPDALSDDF